MTPRQIGACLHFAQRRQRADHLLELSILRVAMHGEQKHMEQMQDAFSDVEVEYETFPDVPPGTVRGAKRRDAKEPG
jgi:hypothetical protein